MNLCVFPFCRSRGEDGRPVCHEHWMRMPLEQRGKMESLLRLKDHDAVSELKYQSTVMQIVSLCPGAFLYVGD